MKLELFILGLALLNLVIVIEVVRRRRMHEHFAMMWLALGIGGIVLAALRPVVDRVSSLLGISYGTSLVFTVSIFFLFVLSMYLSIRVSRLETQIEQLAEHIAFLEGDPLDSPTAPDTARQAGPQDRPT